MRGPGIPQLRTLDSHLLPFPLLLVHSFSLSLSFFPFLSQGHSEGIGCIRCLGSFPTILSGTVLSLLSPLSAAVGRYAAPWYAVPWKMGKWWGRTLPCSETWPIPTGLAIDHGDTQNPLLSQAHSNSGCLFLSTLFISASTYPQAQAGV